MDLLQAILTSLDDNKANDIVLMYLRGIDEAITNFFVVCHGTSTTHVGSLSQNLRAEVKEEQGSIPMGNSGHDTGQWIVLDYFDIVVHIFLEEIRSLYLLEELWSDATRIPIDKDFSVTAIENNYE